MAQHHKEDALLAVEARKCLLAVGEDHSSHHFLARHRELLDRLDKQVAELMVERTFHLLYLPQRLLRETFRQLTAHQLAAIKCIDKRINHIGEDVERTQRKERDDVKGASYDMI